MNEGLGASHQVSDPNTVIVPAADFENGRFPAVCAVTGVLATSNLKRRYSSTPRWVGWLFFINLLALAVAYVFTHQETSGSLPVTSAVARRVEQRHMKVSLLIGATISLWLVAAVLAIIVGGTTGAITGEVGFGIGAAAFVGAMVMNVIEASTLGIQGSVIKDGFGTRWVQLRGVHPAFARAVANRRL